MIKKLNNLRVLILGLGTSGLAMARWCASHGSLLRIADTRPQPPGLTTLQTEYPDAQFMSGIFSSDLLNDIDLIAISPGLSPLELHLKNLLDSAQQKNIPVWGEAEFFAQALACLKEDESYTPRIIAITGTNGKTTVTQLTALLCQYAGRTVAIAGNIGPSLLDTLGHYLDQPQRPEIWVLELSSFQLTHCYSLQAHVATILNITEDHLDWHGDMTSYSNAKARIFDQNTIAVIHRHDAEVSALAKQAKRIITFGDDLPTQAQDLGIENPIAELSTSIAWLVQAQTSEDILPKKKNAAPVEIFIQRLMPVDALRIRGKHNALNALAALALSQAALTDFPVVNISVSSIEHNNNDNNDVISEENLQHEQPQQPHIQAHKQTQKRFAIAKLLHGLRDYRGEPHRVQWIATIQEIDFYDDSKGTNVGATTAALSGLFDAHQSSKKIILIAGGIGKGQNFSALIAAIKTCVRAAFLIGEAAPMLKQLLEPTGIPATLCATLEEATHAAMNAAQAKDIVLLSPACASFDMFKDYEHRAEVFQNTVLALAQEIGEVL